MKENGIIMVKCCICGKKEKVVNHVGKEFMNDCICCECLLKIINEAKWKIF